MEPIQITALLIFLIAVAFIVWGRIDRAVIGMVGVVFMVLFGVMTEIEAFLFVDWNVIAILFSIWIIAGYFGETGIPGYLAVTMLRISRNNIAIFITLMGALSAFISMFVDNVVVILMMAPVVFHITQKMKLPSFPFLIFIGLASNLMGTALLLGDLPPQMLHSVTAIEFPEFVWQMGRPSSLIILAITFLAAAYLFYQFRFRKMYAESIIDDKILKEITGDSSSEGIKNKNFAILVVGVFLATIITMSFRQFTGLHLGFIAFTGMIALIVLTEIFQKKLGSPDFEKIVDATDMRTLFFYITLFALVGGINHVGIIKMIADAISIYIQNNLTIGATLVYWVTAPIVGVVEHDAYILAFLYLIRDIAEVSNVNPWPLYWAVVWAGTLGSNLTIAGAPALYVAQSICEKEDCKTVGLKEFLRYTVPFVMITLIVCFILMMVIWVFPFAL